MREQGAGGREGIALREGGGRFVSFGGGESSEAQANDDEESARGSGKTLRLDAVGRSAAKRSDPDDDDEVLDVSSGVPSHI